jgi:hypothetical protein
MKQIKLMAVALLLVVLVAMPVFAASQVVMDPVGGVTVAYETLGAARTVSLNDTGHPVSVVLGNTLLSGDTVNLALSGGALFGTGTYYLCANNSTPGVTVLGSGTAVTNTTLSLGISSTDAAAYIATGANIWVSSFTCLTTNGAFNFQVGASAPVGAAALSGNAVSYAGLLKTTIAANNVATISRQYGTALSAATLVSIDYINNPANGTTLVTGIAGTSNIVGGGNALLVTNVATLSYNVATISGAFNQVVTLTDGHGDWVGISRVYAITGTTATCAGTAAASANAPASGNIVLHIPNASNFAATATTLCANVAGNVSIPGRSIFGTYTYELATGSGTGLILPDGSGSATTSVWQTWVPNGYQAFNPYMYVGTSQDTLDVFCRFYNSSTQTAQVFVDVYPADGSASTRQTLTSIPSNTAATYWGSTIGIHASLAVGTSYAALFTITAPPGQINGVSFFKRSTGERQLPLYKSVRAADNYLSE